MLDNGVFDDNRWRYLKLPFERNRHLACSRLHSPMSIIKKNQSRGDFQRNPAYPIPSTALLRKKTKVPTTLDAQTTLYDLLKTQWSNGFAHSVQIYLNTLPNLDRVSTLASAQNLLVPHPYSMWKHQLFSLMRQNISSNICGWHGVNEKRETLKCAILI